MAAPLPRARSHLLGPVLEQLFLCDGLACGFSPSIAARGAPSFSSPQRRTCFRKRSENAQERKCNHVPISTKPFPSFPV
jgi:hypothetical protein